MLIQKAINHFVEFHKGWINILLHILGFVGIFYSVYRLSWLMFAVSFVVLESGHWYNHFVGKQKYESNLKVNAWRLVIFVTTVIAMYWISRLV
jgi:hypothetical protein